MRHMGLALVVAACRTTASAPEGEATDAALRAPEQEGPAAQKDTAARQPAEGGPADGPRSPAPDAAAMRDLAAPYRLVGLEAGGAAQPCAFTLCESFEGVAEGARPDPAVWRASSTKIVVDSMHAFRGARALHIPAFAGKGSYTLTTSKGFPPATRRFFGRLFFWIENAPPMGQTYLHWALVNATGRNAAGNDMQHLFGGQAFTGKPDSYFSYNSWSPMGYSGPGSKYHPAGIPLRSWQCVEWTFDTTDSSARFWWNDSEMTAIAWKNPPTQPQFDLPDFRAVAIGWTEFHDAATPWEVWIDEIAIGPERIGCDR